MAEPKVCVSLVAISVEEMIDEATRANIAGADYVEVHFDKLYLNKPEPVISSNDDGEEISKIPPIEEWGVKDFSEIDNGTFQWNSYDPFAESVDGICWKDERYD